jgi:hypothetical protein
MGEMNEDRCKYLYWNREIAISHAGYFFMALHREMFSNGKYVECMMEVLRGIKSQLWGAEAEVQAEFYEDVYAFLKKDKKQQMVEICLLYEKYKRLWNGGYKESIGRQAIKVSIAYLFVMLGVELPEPEEEFVDFQAKVYVDFDKVDTPSLEEAVKYLGYIPVDLSSESVLMDYYERFSHKVYSLKKKSKKGIFSVLRRRICVFANAQQNIK